MTEATPKELAEELREAYHQINSVDSIERQTSRVRIFAVIKALESIENSHVASDSTAVLNELKAWLVTCYGWQFDEVLAKIDALSKKQAAGANK